MKKNKTPILLFTLVLLAALLGGCGGAGSAAGGAADGAGRTAGGSAGAEPAQKASAVQPKSQTYFIFDTVVTVRIYDERAAEQNFKDLDVLLKEIDSRISRTDSSSEIYKVNANSGIAPVKVSPETFNLVAKALDYAKRTDGKFDPAIGNLVSLWNIGHEGAHVPPEEEIAEARRLTDYRKIELNEAAQEIYLQEKACPSTLVRSAKGTRLTGSTTIWRIKAFTARSSILAATSTRWAQSRTATNGTSASKIRAKSAGTRSAPFG